MIPIILPIIISTNRAVKIWLVFSESSPPDSAKNIVSMVINTTANA